MVHLHLFLILLHKNRLLDANFVTELAMWNITIFIFIHVSIMVSILINQIYASKKNLLQEEKIQHGWIASWQWASTTKKIFHSYVTISYKVLKGLVDDFSSSSHLASNREEIDGHIQASKPHQVILSHNLNLLLKPTTRDNHTQIYICSQRHRRPWACLWLVAFLKPPQVETSIFKFSFSPSFVGWRPPFSKLMFSLFKALMSTSFSRILQHISELGRVLGIKLIILVWDPKVSIFTKTGSTSSSHIWKSSGNYVKHSSVRGHP